jgi:hypothetical protein
MEPRCYPVLFLRFSGGNPFLTEFHDAHGIYGPVGGRERHVPLRH